MRLQSRIRPAVLTGVAPCAHRTRALPLTLTMFAALALTGPTPAGATGTEGTGAVMLSPDSDILVRGPAGHIATVTSQSCVLTNMSNRFVLWRVVSAENWVSVTPSGGELAPSGQSLDKQTVEIRPNLAVNELPAGSHVATVTFENLAAGILPISFDTVDESIPIGTRVVRVVADPVLSISTDLPGGVIHAEPEGMLLVDGASERHVYEAGQVVLLTVDVAEGYELQGWVTNAELESTTANPIAIAMDASWTIGASLKPISRTLTLSVSGTGTGTVSYSPFPTVTENDLISRYDDGTEVTLLAEADAGSGFLSWAGNVPAGAEQENPVTVMMDRDRTVTARFEPQVTLTVEVLGAGTVIVEPELEAYAAGTVVSLTTEPEEGSEFSGWSGDAGGDEVTISLTLNADTHVVAVFEPEGSGAADAADEMFTLVVDVVGKGVVSPEGGEYGPGSEVTLIATPDIGSIFVGWEEHADGSELTATVTMDGDQEVRAVFDSDPSAERPISEPKLNPPAICGALGAGGLSIMGLSLATLVGLRKRLRPRAIANR